MTAKRYRLPDVLGGGEIEAGEVAIGKAWRYDFVGGCLWPDERLTEITDLAAAYGVDP